MKTSLSTRKKNKQTKKFSFSLSYATYLELSPSNIIAYFSSAPTLACKYYWMETLPFISHLMYLPKHCLVDSESWGLHVFSHMWNIDTTQIQSILCKQVTLRGGHIWKRKGKRSKLRWWIWLMYFLYENEYRIFKVVEVTRRRGVR
jgi:hypothetical protein